MENYLYGSARIRTLENNLVGRDRLDRMLAVGDPARCVDLLAEAGISVEKDPESGKFLREETLLGRLRDAYREVCAVTENAGFAMIWRYPYDCNNIKAVIKCAYRGVDPAEMLFDFGTIPVEQIVEAQRIHDYSALPEPFASAAMEAEKTFSKNGNPQYVDLILDRVCYRAMLEKAEQGKNAFVISLVKQKIDLTNLLICIRLLRMKSGEAGKILLRNALLSGGNLNEETLIGYYDGGEAYLWDRLLYTDYEKFASEGSVDSSLTVVERAADDFWMESVKKAKMIPYGEETLVAYLIAAEYEVRNLRIVLAGIEAGIPAGVVGERIRKSYV